MPAGLAKGLYMHAVFAYVSLKGRQVSEPRPLHLVTKESSEIRFQIFGRNSSEEAAVAMTLIDDFRVASSALYSGCTYGCAHALCNGARCTTGMPSPGMKPALRNSAFAPLMQRSLTVPLTARSPMHPPGKNRGCTTQESVEKASRRASASRPCSDAIA